MLGKILTNNSQKTNKIIFATIELNQLKKIYDEKGMNLMGKNGS